MKLDDLLWSVKEHKHNYLDRTPTETFLLLGEIIKFLEELK